MCIISYEKINRLLSKWLVISLCSWILLINSVYKIHSNTWLDHSAVTLDFKKPEQIEGDYLCIKGLVRKLLFCVCQQMVSMYIN